MSLIPDHASLWKDSLPAIEVLAIAALYLYSIDQRESAYIYLGQAIRIAQFEGLHTQLPEEQLGLEVVTRCRNLWWTLYIMDRHFSYSVGLPMTTTDSDISASINPPDTCLTEDVAFTLQAKLSRLMSFILTSVYKSERTTLGVFLDTTRSILETLAGCAQEVERLIHLQFRNSMDTMPNSTQHITLLYHQCVIVATRPLLLSALMERLEKLDSEGEDWRGFLVLTKTLISTGIKSAAKTLQILSGDDGHVEVFLPYNLEFAYAAAIHLVMATALFPEVETGQCCIQQSYSILDRMITNGNRIAQARRDELLYLENLFQELSSRAVSQGLKPFTLDIPDGAEATTEIRMDDRNGTVPDGKDDPISLDDHDPLWMGYSIPGPHAPYPTDMGVPSVELLSYIGISSADFLSIVDQIGNPDISYSAVDYGPRADEG
ncbi:Zn(II)2Cys6 transcription factor [Penicillium digitatum]|nr:Zn(II)2Cys6 transcription factor [Penicillium digitatum]